MSATKVGFALAPPRDLVLMTTLPAVIPQASLPVPNDVYVHDPLAQVRELQDIDASLRHRLGLNTVRKPATRSLWQGLWASLFPKRERALSSGAEAALEELVERHAKRPVANSLAVHIGSHAAALLEKIEDVGANDPVVQAKLQTLALPFQEASPEQKEAASQLKSFADAIAYETGRINAFIALSESDRLTYAELVADDIAKIDRGSTGMAYNDARRLRAAARPALPLPDHIEAPSGAELSDDRVIAIASRLATVVKREAQLPRQYRTYNDIDYSSIAHKGPAHVPFDAVCRIIEEAQLPERTDVERAVIGGVAAILIEQLDDQQVFAFPVVEQLDVLKRIGERQPPEAIAKADTLLEAFRVNRRAELAGALAARSNTAGIQAKE